MARATSLFDLDVFDQDEPYFDDDGVQYAKVRIEKTFRGDLVATSTVEMLSVRGDGGAGYVALERIAGMLEGRIGSFAIAHLGTMVGDKPWAKWPIVPGTGTGELTGISGEATIEIAPDGAHTLLLDYELSQANT